MKPSDGKEWEIFWKSFILFLINSCMFDLSCTRGIFYAFTYLTFKKWLTGLFLQSRVIPGVQNFLDILTKLWTCVYVHLSIFFSGEEIHSFLICKRFDDTPKEKKELLPWNVFNATLGTRDLHRSCDECQTPLYFLKIPLENIFWLIVLSFSFCFSFCFSRWCFCLLSPYCNKALIKYLSAVGDLSSILRNIMCKVQILLSRITV